jgi:hypothetical protein
MIDAPLSAPPPLAPAKPKRPPLPWLTILVGGAAYGLLMRLIFGLWPFAKAVPGTGPMLVSFLFFVPLVIGIWSVSRLPAEQRNVGSAILVPWAPLFLFTAGTAALAIEGSICIALAIPIFMFMASFGGLVALLALKKKPSTATTSGILVLPLLLAVAEQGMPLTDATLRSTESVHIAAPPERIWHLINDATEIRPKEMESGWAWRIGVPYPVSAITVDENGGRVRKLRWQKGVHFDEPILDWDENRYIRWSYRFDADSIPDGALDDHVRVGGAYFDLVDTSYRLEPEGDGTRLTIDVGYRVSTRFNWYSARLGRWLVDDAAKTILEFYRRRTEAESDGHPA